MKIKLNFPALRQTTWYEYALRFMAGGLVTALVGVIAKKFGPGIGGLFLAFPAVFPSSATLVEKHEEERKQRRGLQGTQSGKAAAGYDAAGAAMGSVGLFVFAILVWRLLPLYETWAVLTVATFAWFGASLAVWRIFPKREGK